MDFVFDNRKPIRSSWNPVAMLIRGRLTDKKIADYEKRGFYSDEYRTARKDRMIKAMQKRMERRGNFLKGENGRMIYSPK